jgi:hypothetical protein
MNKRDGAPSSSVAERPTFYPSREEESVGADVQPLTPSLPSLDVNSPIFELFSGVRGRNLNNSDAVDSQVAIFDALGDWARQAFNHPPQSPNFGPGYLGHFAFTKVGEACICRSSTESASVMNGAKVESLDFWDQINILIYLVKTTLGKEFYCTRFVLDEAIRKYNKYREVRYANSEMYEALRLLT